MTWFLARAAFIVWLASMFYVAINAPVSFFILGVPDVSGS